ncbi:GTPase [Hydrogenobacter thermophilus TK-6]|uniref:Gliding motility protein n=1 Tax=Hydrogenobacter thermophilus (strain DSM 6534 / IAM 12695 / TK-6) TaxID=608538 RepID=D3DKC2_HYDTT|nr:ADP-ribosylation factor-like protein [Hydrogenobacter thermophilus]ADO46194.1 GTPase [Hydrogenobacter thermophilus TK-6]BAI70274.1 gliding motility protein [Hydrogenobacter thermophilus TK-6]
MKLKVVYFGSSLAGKSTNVKKLYEILKERGLAKGEFVSMETDEQRTLFVEMFVSSLNIEGVEMDVKIMTTPGQFRLHPLRKVIVKGVDGLVFVVDSSVERKEVNFLVMRETAAVLKEQGHDLLHFPVVVQYNKRDLPSAMPIDDMQMMFNPWDTDYVESVAIEGKGVLETFVKIIKNILVAKHGKSSAL